VFFIQALMLCIEGIEAGLRFMKERKRQSVLVDG
jgi:hypothetical protein